MKKIAIIIGIVLFAVYAGAQDPIPTGYEWSSPMGALRRLQHNQEKGTYRPGRHLKGQADENRRRFRCGGRIPADLDPEIPAIILGYDHASNSKDSKLSALWQI